MNASPISALAAHHQPRPRLPLSDARQGNVPSLAPQSKLKQQTQLRPQLQGQAQQPQQAPQPLATEMQQGKPGQQEKQKQLPEPKKEKVRPASPPPLIRDANRTLSFTKVGFLGEVCVVFRRLDIVFYAIVNVDPLL